MKIFRKSLLVLLALVISFDIVGIVQAATSPSLGAADSYSVLAGSIITNTGSTTVNANLGISPGIGIPPHFTGFPPGIVGPPGVIHDADTNAAAAQADDTAVFGFIDQGCDTTYPGVQDLTLVSPLVAGTYCATGSFTLTGNLTLSGTGVWIFKSASTIITSPGSSVTGGSPCNIWWRAVSSVTLDTTTSFIGNVMALTSITMNNGATLNGRLLAQTGAITLDNNVITTTACTSLPGTGGVIPEKQTTPWNVVILAFAGLSTVALLMNSLKRKSASSTSYETMK